MTQSLNSRLLALLARTNLPQVGIGVNASRMAVVPVELDSIMPNGYGPGNADHFFSVHRKGIGSCFDGRWVVTAGGAGAALPQVGVRVNGLVAVIPADEYAAWSRQLDGSRQKGHGYTTPVQTYEELLRFNYRGLGCVEVCDAHLSCGGAGDIQERLAVGRFTFEDHRVAAVAAATDGWIQRNLT